MAEPQSAVDLAQLANHFMIPQGFLDEECADEHIKDIALLLDSWDVLASQLRLSSQQINSIREDKGSQEVKRERTLSKWKETFSFKATYRKLLEVLLKIKRTDLASKVCQLLISSKRSSRQAYTFEKQFPMAPSSLDSQLMPMSVIPLPPTGTLNRPSPFISPMSHSESPRPGSQRLIPEYTTIADIEEAYVDLVVKVEEYFEENVKLKKLKRYSCHLPVSLKGQFGQLFEGKTARIWNASTVGELFSILSYFWDYLHPHLLHYLVNRFASTEPEIVNLMNMYQEELATFRRKVKIPDYIGNRGVNLVDEDYTPIIATLGDEWREKTLADLEEVRCDFSKKFSFLQLLPKMNGVKYNSIALVFSVPKSVRFDRDELCEFFRSHNVLKLTIGDECIYDDSNQQDLEIHDQADGLCKGCQTLTEAEEETVLESDAKTDKDASGRDTDSEHQEGHFCNQHESELRCGPNACGFTCEFIEKPPKGVQCECPVCLQILREPHQVTCCGYSFCQVCIERLKSENKHCPTCKEENITIFPDKRLHRSLYDYKVYCTHRDKGCSWSGELRQLENHLNEEPQANRELEGCLFAHVDCKFKSVGCEVRVAREDVAAHLKDHSKIHLQLLKNCKSSRDRAFLKAQELIAKLSHQVLEVNKTIAKINSKHEHELHEIQDEIKEKYEQELSQLNEQLAEVKAQDQLLLAQVLDQHQEEITSLKQRHEEEVVTLNGKLYKLLQQKNQVPAAEASNTQEESPTSGLLDIAMPIPPVTFTLTQFAARKRDDIIWWSPSFYSHHCGYKMSLRVYSNGDPDTKCHRTYVSVYIYFKRGEFDDHLKWPFSGYVKVTLLDQEDHNTHHSAVIDYSDHDAQYRVTQGISANSGWGRSGFISHKDLEPKYLKNDCLQFEITNVILE